MTWTSLGCSSDNEILVVVLVETSDRGSNLLRLSVWPEYWTSDGKYVKISMVIGPSC